MTPFARAILIGAAAIGSIALLLAIVATIGLIRARRKKNVSPFPESRATPLGVYSPIQQRFLSLDDGIERARNRIYVPYAQERKGKPS